MLSRRVGFSATAELSCYKKQYLSNGQDSCSEISHNHCKYTVSGKKRPPLNKMLQNAQYITQSNDTYTA